MNTMTWPHYRDEITYETYQNTSTRRAFPLKTSSQMSLSKRFEGIHKRRCVGQAVRAVCLII